MKIAYIQGPYPRLTESYLLDQIVALLKSGHEVDIIASRYAGQPKSHPDIEKYGLKARFMGLPEKRWQQVIKVIFLVFIHFWRAPKVIGKSLNYKYYDCPSLDIYLRVIYATILLSKSKVKAYDIIHCHIGYVGIMGVALRRIGVIKGKIITTFHSSDAYSYPHKWKHNVYETLWKDGELNTVGSNYMGNTIKALGAKPERTRVLPLGLDLDKFEFKERRLSDDGIIRVVTVARLVEKKGLEYSVRAFAKVCNQNPNQKMTYQIAGEGPFRQRLEPLIEELGMNGKIQLLGWQDQPEVATLLETAHLFVFPSVTAKDGNKESQALALQEAQAVGLPVVTTIHNGLPEGMLDQQSGFLVPERDVDGLAEKLNYLVNHPERWVEMGTIGRAFVEEKFEINMMNERLIQIYEELAYSKTKSK